MDSLTASATGIETPEPGFVVALDGFNGPLDLLLHLVREEQIDIADIPIARIADQFLKAIHALGLNQAADYLEMAGRLVRLKAQMLLPRRDEEGWEDPRSELVRRLLEYQQIKEIALWLARAAERRSARHGRGWLPPMAANCLDASLCTKSVSACRTRAEVSLMPVSSLASAISSSSIVTVVRI